VDGHGGGQQGVSFLLHELAERAARIRRLQNELYRTRLSRDLWRNRALKAKRR
jgi:hypothetical protein